MRSIILIVVVSVVLLIVLLVGYTRFGYFGFKLFDCDNRVIKDLKSPDGKYSATVFERDCGATTSYVTVVSVRDSSSKFKGDRVDDFVFTMKGRPQIDIRWEDGRHLVIKRPTKNDDIFKELRSWKEVRISYTTASQ